jgi:hypothetical protein
METRKCPECNEIKPSTEYYKCSTNKSGLQDYCKICKKEKFRDSKRKSDKKYHKKYYSIPENRENKAAYSRQYHLDNPEKQKAYCKKHRQTEKWRIKSRARRKKEHDEKYGMDKDPIFTLKLILRNRLKNALKNQINGVTFKKGKTLEMLGCSMEEFKVYLENKFTPEMNWENYGIYWELDHIKPFDAFNLSNVEEQKKCCIFTNIQPLGKIDNRIKSNKYEQ